jgi:hypothetical protein
MAARVLVGGAFAAVVLLLAAIVSLPLWIHPMQSDEAVALARAQPGLAALEVTDVFLSVSVDGRVADRRGITVYKRPDPSLRAGPLTVAAPHAFWVVEMQSASQPCASATVVIDALNRNVLASRRPSASCRRF